MKKNSLIACLLLILVSANSFGQGLSVTELENSVTITTKHDEVYLLPISSIISAKVSHDHPGNSGKEVIFLEVTTKGLVEKVVGDSVVVVNEKIKIRGVSLKEAKNVCSVIANRMRFAQQSDRN